MLNTKNTFLTNILCVSISYSISNKNQLRLAAQPESMGGVKAGPLTLGSMGPWGRGHV